MKKSAKWMVTVFLALLMLWALPCAACAEQAITLEDIAEINGMDVSELNICRNDEGNITFIGNQFTKLTIQSKEDENWDLVVSGIAGLIGGKADDEYLLMKETQSPVTGAVYYTVSATERITIDGIETLSAACNRQFTMAFDKDGNAISVSSALYEEPVSYAGEAITRAEAAEYIQSELISQVPGMQLLEDTFTLIYWQSETLAGLYGGSCAPCWGVYADQSACSDVPYRFIVVPALRSTYYEAFGVDTLNILFTVDTQEMDYAQRYSQSPGMYASAEFFDDFEDAGEYTYVLDMSLLAASTYAETCPYIGEETIEVTVPVMQCKSNGKYYLGDVNRLIVVSNFADYSNNSAPANLPCTETPEDVNSWHFEMQTDEATGTEYFFDPAFVISSYATLVNTYDVYNGLYGYKGVNLYGMPTCLCVYYYSQEEYPDDISEFDINAQCAKEEVEWEIFRVSPTFCGYLEPDVMAHEYGHGINGDIAYCDYKNETGAVIEAYGDILGKLSTMIYYGEETDTWNMSGKYSPVMRCMSDPISFNQPMLYNGTNYIPAIPDVLANLGVADTGGVHTNNSVPSYVCYLMANSGDASDLTLKETLDVWLEALYSIKTSTRFNELGHYLVCASQHVGLSEEKQSHVYDILNTCGFLEDDTEINKLIAEEESNSYLFTIDESACAAAMYEAAVYIGGGAGNVGATTEGVLSVHVSPTLSGDVYFQLYVLHDGTADELVVLPFAETEGNEYTLVLKERYIAAGETIPYDEGDTPTVDGVDQDTVVSEPGMFFITADNETSKPGEQILYIVCAE